MVFCMLGVVFEKSDEVNEIFEDIIDCLDLPGIKEITGTLDPEISGFANTPSLKLFPLKHANYPG